MNDTEWYSLDERWKIVVVPTLESTVAGVGEMMVKANVNGVFPSGDLCDSP